MGGTYEATVVLYDCKPLKARLSKEACAQLHAKKRSLVFNNDPEGLPFDYERCSVCSGVTGKGEAITVTAGDPKPERVPVFTQDGRWGYV